jgi:hypothetical protein
LLVSQCVGGECDKAVSDEDRGRSWKLGAEDCGRSDTTQVRGGQTIGRSGDVVRNPYRTHGGDEKRGFSGLASKPVGTVCERFGLKTTTTVSWFGPQNQVGGGLFVCASKPMIG